MRTLCDSCESAAAVLFCAADEAALCQSCDNKIHMCNKLANRHVRVGLAEPSGVPRCDICENAPAFFYCEIDGSSLCLQCDTVVHVGGKRTHGRYLVLRQQIQFPGDKVSPVEELDESQRKQNQLTTTTMMETEDQQKQGVSGGNADGNPKTDKNNSMIDLNMKPNRIHEHASNTQDI